MLTQRVAQSIDILTYVMIFQSHNGGRPHCAMLCAEYDTVICHICHLLRRVLLIIHIGLVEDALRLVFLDPSTLLPLREQIARSLPEVGHRTALRLVKHFVFLTGK